jgi:hypothetical protein
LGGIGTLDVLLVAFCSPKFVDGAWFPLVVAAVIFFFMSTWARGSAMLQAAVCAEQPPLAPFLVWLAQEPIQRIPHVAVYAVADADVVPPALALNLRNYKARLSTAIPGRSNTDILRRPPRTDQQHPMHPTPARGPARVPCAVRVMRVLPGVCWLAGVSWLTGVCWQARARTGVWWQAYGARHVLADMCSQA